MGGEEEVVIATYNRSMMMMVEMQEIICSSRGYMLYFITRLALLLQIYNVKYDFLLPMLIPHFIGCVQFSGSFF